MKKHLLASAIAVTVLWSPTFRANPSPSNPIPSPARDHSIGIASWYGEEFQGRPTASGEIYDMNGLTAAHREIPLGKWVEVTNLRNDRSAIVRINDRGPWIPGRMIDVSKATAWSLGFMGSGTATVRVRVLDSPPGKRSPRPRAARSQLVSSAETKVIPNPNPVVQQ